MGNLFARCLDPSTISEDRDVIRNKDIQNLPDIESSRITQEPGFTWNTDETSATYTNMGFTDAVREGQGTINSQDSESSTREKSFSNTNSASVTTTSNQVKDTSVRQKSYTCRNSACSEVKESSTSQTSFSNKNSAGLTTTISQAKESSKRDLSRDETIHILHFLHAYPGTSVFLVVLLHTALKSNGEPIFLKMYKNIHVTARKSSIENKNKYHAEKQLCNDEEDIVKVISNYPKHDANNHVKVILFQNNSPCNRCSADLQRFKSSIESRLQTYTKNPIQFEIQVKYILNKNGDKDLSNIKKLMGNGITVGSLDYVQFYKYLCEWMSLNILPKSQSSVILVGGQADNVSMIQESLSNESTDTFTQFSFETAGKNTINNLEQSMTLNEHKITKEEVLKKLLQVTEKSNIHLLLEQIQETRKCIGSI